MNSSISIRILALVIGLMLMLAGCMTDDVSRFYEPNTSASGRKLKAFSGTTEIYSTSDIRSDGDKLLQRGYFPIGVSSFNTPSSVTKEQILSHAKKVGSDIVLISSSYAGSSQIGLPISQFNPGQTKTTYASGSVNANAQGPGGFSSANAQYAGTATTTTSGSYSTAIMPVTIHRNDYALSFWRKDSPPIFGIQGEGLPDVMRKRLNRNTGVLVTLVGDETPAFYANILKGDVITAFNSEPVTSTPHLIAIIEKNAGKNATVTVLRENAEIILEIRLNAKN